jgi:hypothetical protein
MVRRIMPAKNRRASDGPELHNRASRAVQSHPWMTLSTLSALVAILPVLGGGLLWALGFIETSAHAQAREDKLRDELKANVASIYAEINKNKRDSDDFKAGYIRESAGVFRQLLDNKVYVARNRVNDCNVARSRKTPPMTPMEESACKQYDEEYAEAKRKYENQDTAATQTWQTWRTR